MKRQILTFAAVLALVFAGAVFAQSPQNTTAPGPTQEQEPGLTNNDLPNPGNPQTQVNHQNTATESMSQEQAAPAEEQAPASATSTTTTTTETSATGSTESAEDTGSTTETSEALPQTASDLPTVALIGLLSLGAAFLLRYARRKA
jgi:LPXTG-motif cell wall-anchored protein